MSMASRRIAAVLVVATAFLAACSGGDDAGGPRTPAAPRPLNEASVLDLRGIDGVTVGMTVDEASAAAGLELTAMGGPFADDQCQYYRPDGVLDGLAFMVVEGRVARVDVIAGPVATTTGVVVGQSESEAQRRYGDELEVTPHKYVEGGHYLTLVPPDPADAAFRLVIETDGAAVTGLRSGRLPEVEFVEGCS